ncbi:MAG: hypothetical protein ACREPM_25060 [Gemmatimonadaceae bacterium]
MGYETTCRARVDDRAGLVREADARVLLETDDLVVRGEARVKVPRTSIERVSVRAGVLTVTAPSAIVSLTLGAEAAAEWRAKIEEPPKRLIDKLDVKPGAKVWLLSVRDETLASQLDDRTPNVSRGTTARGCDVVFVGVESERDLARIERATRAMTPNGAVWVIHRKGPTGVADTTIFGKAKALGLVYTKVARVSDTHTAEKLVRPRDQR